MLVPHLGDAITSPPQQPAPAVTVPAGLVPSPQGMVAGNRPGRRTAKSGWWSGMSTSPRRRPGRVRRAALMGQQRRAEVAPETGIALVGRVQAGALSLVALHSARWSAPFVRARSERTRADAGRALHRDHGDKVEIGYQEPPRRYTLPRADGRLTPYTALRKFPDGAVRATAHPPYCCCPAYRTDRPAESGAGAEAGPADRRRAAEGVRAAAHG
jgi:hypothetical protein